MTEYEKAAREIVIAAQNADPVIAIFIDQGTAIRGIAAAVKEAVEAETERCAKVAEGLKLKFTLINNLNDLGYEPQFTTYEPGSFIAGAIRSRKG